MSKQIMRPVHILIIFVMICVQFTFVGTTNVAARPVTQQRGEPGTPMQVSLQQAFEQRIAQGLPAPTFISYESDVTVDQRQADLQSLTSSAPQHAVNITSRTTIHFDNPQQAGYDKWPDLIVQDEMPEGATGSIQPGNYNQLIHDKLAEQLPGIWDEYEFGYEPRTYTFVETFTSSFDAQESAFFEQLSESTLDATTVEEILLGFTITGPDYDYSIDWSFDVLGVTVIDFWVGFAFDYGLGLRLPLEASLTTPELVSEGGSFAPSSFITGLDWTAADFQQAGIAPEDGNEFFMRFIFKVGIFLKVFGADVIDLGVDLDEEQAKSFETPFGPGAYFSIPGIQVPLWEADAAVASLELGFSMTPLLGSDKVTATWQTTGDFTGSGQIQYTAPLVPQSLGSMPALDGPSQTDIQLSEFRYYFTQFLIQLDAYIQLDVFEVWDGTFAIPITDFDLSALTGNLYVGVHNGTPGSISNTTEVENVSPTAVIDKSGTVKILGVDTFMIHGGTPLTVTGYTTDPGRDDLTLEWDWDDGPPVPDTSTFYLIPYSVTESHTRTFQNSCRYDIKFTVADDDGGTAFDQVPVLVTGKDAKVRYEGYWQHQYGGQGKLDFNTATLECYLELVRHMSSVFGEVRDLSDIEAAHAVLTPGLKKGNILDQFDRELLAVWLNVANGAIDHDELLDTNRDGLGDTSFADLVATAEQVRLNPQATVKQLMIQIRLLHLIYPLVK